MLKKLIVAVLLLIANICSAQSNVQSTSVINAQDTVVFDISQSIVNGTTVEFPVYFLSDDTINALDFSFKYNQLNFMYDSILDLTTYISDLSYYNPNDSLVRFTSFSFTNYSNNTPLVIIRFTILSGQFCSVDLNTIHTYLNGDACSFKVIDCVPNSTNEYLLNNKIILFPNPASDNLTLKMDAPEIPYPVNISIYNTMGMIMESVSSANLSSAITLSVSHLPKGVYVIGLQTDNALIRKAFVKN